MKKILFGIFFACSIYAALPTNGTLVFETRPTNGSDNNGGCYVTGSTGTDFSQQNSPQNAFTDLIIGATTTQATSVLNPFASTDVGNCVQVVSGSGCTTGFYQIVSVATITATMDRSLGSAASVCTANEGGALKTIGKWNTLLAATCGGTCGWGNWVKAEATITTTTSFSFSSTTNANAGVPIFLSGYTTTRGDGGRVTIQQTAEISFDNAIIAIANNIGGMLINNFTLDCNAQTGSRSLTIQGTQGPNVAQNILATNCKSTSGSIELNNSGHWCMQCTVTGQGTGGPSFSLDAGNGGNNCLDCVAVNGAGPGFVYTYSTCIRCIAANNTGATSDGFQITANSTANIIYLDSVISYNNGRDGLRLSPGEIVHVTNSVFYGNAGFGINDTRNNLFLGFGVFDYNAFGGNTSGARSQVPVGSHDVTLSGDPFTNGASNNFAPLSSTIKGVGFPGALSLGGTGHLDIGTLQSSGSGGGASAHPIIQ